MQRRIDGQEGREREKEKEDRSEIDIDYFVYTVIFLGVAERFM